MSLWSWMVPCWVVYGDPEEERNAQQLGLRHVGLELVAGLDEPGEELRPGGRAWGGLQPGDGVVQPGVRDIHLVDARVDVRLRWIGVRDQQIGELQPLLGAVLQLVDAGQLLQAAGAFADPGDEVRPVGPAPDTVQGSRGAAGHGAPGGTVVVHDGAVAPYGVDVETAVAPDFVEAAGGAAGHAAPGGAVVVPDGAVGADGEDIRGRGAPDPVEVVGGAAGHGAPGGAVIVPDGAARAYRGNVRGGGAADGVEIAGGAAGHGAPGGAVVVPDGAAEPTAKTFVEEAPQTPRRSLVVPLVMALQAEPS